MLLLLACVESPDPKDAPADTADTTATADTADPCPECDCGHGTIGIDNCQDADVNIGPDCPEDCNGIDDDCDGEVDEGLTTRMYADTDGDGYGDPGAPLDTCELPYGYASNADDCDDADAGVNPAADEVCDGVDQDCDGEIDEDTDTVEGYADADGDGYGDPDAYGVGCAGDGVARVDDASDCDDADGAVNPDAIERSDGVDQDCDGLVDEAAVVVVIGYQCQVYAASTWTSEEAAIQSYLADLGLSWDEVLEDGSTSDDENQVFNYDLGLFCKCGWEWKDYNQDMIDAFLRARTRGMATFLFDDDIAWKEYQVVNADTLTFLHDASSNGTRGQTAEFDTTSLHPAYAGPYGTPTDFVYNWDIDVTTPVGLGEVVLGTHSGGSPWFVAWEDTTTGARAATLVTGLVAANEGNVGTDAEAQLEIVFKNTVTWLLDL